MKIVVEGSQKQLGIIQARFRSLGVKFHAYESGLLNAGEVLSGTIVDLVEENADLKAEIAKLKSNKPKGRPKKAE
jgi:hypothetical protein